MSNRQKLKRHATQMRYKVAIPKATSPVYDRDQCRYLKYAEIVAKINGPGVYQRRALREKYGINRWTRRMEEVVTYVHKHPGCKAEDIAEHFGTKRRSIAHFLVYNAHVFERRNVNAPAKISYKNPYCVFMREDKATDSTVRQMQRARAVKRKWARRKQ